MKKVILMSELKNIYGENVAWFCLEGSVTLQDLQANGDGTLDGEFEVYGEDEKGNEGTVNIDVISLLESANVVINEQSEELEQLRKERDDLESAARCFRSSVAANHAIHEKNMIGGDTRRALARLNELLDKQ